MGPGSYNISAKAMNANSQYIENKAIKFAQCPRPSMALGFRSPGPIYQLEVGGRTDHRAHIKGLIVRVST